MRVGPGSPLRSGRDCGFGGACAIGGPLLRSHALTRSAPAIAFPLALRSLDHRPARAPIPRSSPLTRPDLSVAFPDKARRAADPGPTSISAASRSRGTRRPAASRHASRSRLSASLRPGLRFGGIRASEVPLPRSPSLTRSAPALVFPHASRSRDHRPSHAQIPRSPSQALRSRGRIPGQGPQGRRSGNCVECFHAWKGIWSRMTALAVTRSLRQTATRASLKGLPASRRVWKKVLKRGQCRMAARAPM